MFSTTIRSICMVAVMFPVTALARDQLRFDRLFVIGDSLGDGGTYSQAVQAGAGGTLPASTGRFTRSATLGLNGSCGLAAGLSFKSGF